MNLCLVGQVEQAIYFVIFISRIAWVSVVVAGQIAAEAVNLDCSQDFSSIYRRMLKEKAKENIF